MIKGMITVKKVDEKKTPIISNLMVRPRLRMKFLSVTEKEETIRRTARMATIAIDVSFIEMYEWRAAAGQAEFILRIRVEKTADADQIKPTSEMMEMVPLTSKRDLKLSIM